MNRSALISEPHTAKYPVISIAHLPLQQIFIYGSSFMLGLYNTEPTLECIIRIRRLVSFHNGGGLSRLLRNFLVDA